MGDIRIGVVSEAEYDTGRVKVNYKDKSNAVSPWMEYFHFNGEYKVPKIGSNVIALILENGKGIVLGGYLNKNTILSRTGKGVYVKELDEEPGKGCIYYKSGTIQMKADNIEFVMEGKIIKLSQILEKVGL